MYYTVNELKSMGVNLKSTINIHISKSVNIYNPENLTINNDIRIDDYTIISCKGKLEIGEFVKISSHCLISSEKNIMIDKCCNISSGVKMYGGVNSNDDNFANPLINNKYNNIFIGDIIIKNYSNIGANSVIYPDVTLNEGSTIQPLSMVNINTEPWKVYGGNPIKIIKNKKVDFNVINNVNNELYFNSLYNEELEFESKKKESDITLPLQNKEISANSGIQKKINVLITGGAKGIGKTLATNFLKNGYNVIITYNSSYEEAILLKNMGIHIYKLDITNNGDCITTLNSIIDDFTTIDILINNAGIIKNDLFHKMKYEDWFDVINTNLISLYNITNPVINNMLKHNKGKIINISSIYGLKGSKGQSNYCSSKFGVIGFTKTLALEYGNKNIQTNCICPGLVDTDMIDKIDSKILEKILNNNPINKLIHPDEIFDICQLLINSNFCNGSIFNIDGGMNS